MTTRLIRLLFALVAAALLPLAARAAPDDDPFAAPWVDVCLDCPPRVEGLSNRSAALAPDGALHAVYGSDAIYHLTYNGGAPVVETLETTTAANVTFSPPVMGIDNRGRVHALYLKLLFEPVDGGVRPVGTLRYARQTAQGWRLETLPFTPRDPFRYALAVAADGRLHVSAHTDAGTIYATRDANGWSAAQPFDNIIFETTLTLDPAGRPAACYPNGSASLALARHDGAAWQIETIPAATRPTSSCVVAFDGDGRPHLVYRADEGLLYQRRNATGWARETIVAATADALPGYAPSLRLDPDGRPHVAFHTQVPPPLLPPDEPPRLPVSRLHYATRTLTGWKVETVDGQPNARQGTMLLAGSAPYVLYRDRLGVALAERRDGQWAVQRLQRSGDVGYGLALVARGLSFQAAHSDAENRAVLYANGGPANWRVEPVDQQSPDLLSPAAGVDLALAPNGAPHLVYALAEPPAGFTHAVRAATGWQRTPLPGNRCGPYRLVAGPAGRVGVTQRRCAQDGLEYIPWPPGSGATELIDPAARFPGGAQAMAVDGQGRVHVAYTAAGAGGRIVIRHARRGTGGRWTLQTVSEGPFNDGTTLGVGLALDGAGRPFVVFNDDAAIAVATQGSGGAWQIDRRLAAGGVAEPNPGLAVDALGRVHVLYNSQTGGGLVYGRRDAAGWQTTTLGPARAHHALALDPFGNPAVAYRDEAGGDARLAYVPATLRGRVYAPIIRR